MHPRFAAFPSALAAQARIVRLGPGEIPALLVHPDWRSPAPTLIWMHGRTAHKELDPGRYLRLMRAGIACCAIDLPGHGERPAPRLHSAADTIDVALQALGEVDTVVEAFADPGLADGAPDLFDLDRLAIGGMSAGGMVTLRRLCDPHPFRCALVESTNGRLGEMYLPGADGRAAWPVDHAPERVAALDPSAHLDGFRPIPLLAIHTETDALVPFEMQRRFVEDLRSHYVASGADGAMVELVTFRDTGAPQEHAGFGRFGAAAKDSATAFLVEHLLG